MSELKLNPNVAASLKQWHAMLGNRDLSGLPEMLDPQAPDRDKTVLHVSAVQPGQDRQREQADNHRGRAVDGVRRQPRVPASFDAGPQQHPDAAHRLHRWPAHAGQCRHAGQRLHRGDEIGRQVLAVVAAAGAAHVQLGG